MKKKSKPIELQTDLFFRFARYTIFAAVLYFVGTALAQQLSQIDFSPRLFFSQFVLVSVFFETCARFLIGLTYALLLRYMSSPLSLRLSIGISWVSFLGKYLPGKIALAAGAAYLLGKQKVPISVAVLVPVLSTLMTICVAFLISIPMLQSHFLMLDTGILLIAAIGVFCIIGLCFFQRDLLLAFSKRIFDRIGISISSLKLSPLQVVSCLVLVISQSLCAGGSTWMICNAIHPLDISFLLTIVSISAFSRVMGLLAFFSPAGIGVMDGLLFIALQEITGAQNAALITILLRLVQTIVDIGTSGIGGILLYSSAPKSR